MQANAAGRLRLIVVISLREIRYWLSTLMRYQITRGDDALAFDLSSNALASDAMSQAN